METVYQHYDPQLNFNDPPCNYNLYFLWMEFFVPFIELFRIKTFLVFDIKKF